MRRDAFGFVVALMLLLIRGITLWLLVPVGALIWVVTPQGVGANRTSLGSFLGWIDNNFCFLLVRGPLRPAFPEPMVVWIPARERARVTHRIRFMDVA